MIANYVLDASALIAFLNNENGALKVERILKNVKKENTIISMCQINLLEVYYGIYRAEGKKTAQDILSKIKELPIQFLDNISNEAFFEAGRLKAQYRISLADAIALAEAKINNAYLITADHHELDLLEEKKEALICWIR